MNTEGSKESYLDVSVFFNASGNELNSIIGNYNSVILLCDDNSHKYCLPYLTQTYQLNLPFEVITIDSGEKNKNLSTCTTIWTKLLKLNVTKKSILIALGGGVVCDIAGFVASTYKRGIDFLFFPTTLLAMVDASIGGKNGVDVEQYKNMVGTINQPKAIFIDTFFLNTLPEVELKNGFAESIKHSLISNANYFYELDNKSSSNLSAIKKSALIKMGIVEQDEHEKNIRKALNAGHTIGHAIESFSFQDDENSISHGYAVAFGLYCEAYISNALGLLSKDEFNSIYHKLKPIYEKFMFEKKDIDTIIAYMSNDKKNDAQINFTLLKGIGNVALNQNASLQLIRESLENYLTNY